MLTCVRKKKLVYDSHELWIEWQQNNDKTLSESLWWWQLIETYGTSSSDLAITVSDGIGRKLQRLYKIQKPLVIRNCAPLKPIIHSKKLRELIGGCFFSLELLELTNQAFWSSFHCKSCFINCYSDDKSNCWFCWLY